MGNGFIESTQRLKEILYPLGVKSPFRVSASEPTLAGGPCLSRGPPAEPAPTGGLQPPGRGRREVSQRQGTSAGCLLQMLHHAALTGRVVAMHLLPSQSPSRRAVAAAATQRSSRVPIARSLGRGGEEEFAKRILLPASHEPPR